MKKMIIAIMCASLLFPMGVLADTQVRDFRETVESIGLTFKATDYKETKDQATVYLFRMTTCEHCHDAITWLNDIGEEYGYKFKLRSLEVTGNDDNNELYKKTTEYLNIKAGVPLIIVGNNHFRGFSDKTKDKILAAIDEVYESKDEYDIFEEMEKNPIEDESRVDTKIEKRSFSPGMLVFVIAGVIVVGLIVFVIFKK